MLEIKDFISQKAMYRYTLTFNKFESLASFMDKVSLLANLIEGELPDVSFDLKSVVYSFDNETDQITNTLGYSTLMDRWNDDSYEDDNFDYRELSRMEDYLDYVARYIKYLKFIGENHSIEVIEIN